MCPNVNKMIFRVIITYLFTLPFPMKFPFLFTHEGNYEKQRIAIIISVI